MRFRRWFLDFFLGSYHPTLSSSYAKSAQARWPLDVTEHGFVVHGVDRDGQRRDFHVYRIDHVNDLLDYALSFQTGEQYRRETYGTSEPHSYKEALQRLRAVNNYRMRHYREAYKPGWKRLLGW